MLKTSKQGSILIFSYFLIAVLLGLAIPQTMRSLSSARLETRFVDSRQLWHLGDADLDDAIKTVRDNPLYGVQDCPGGVCEPVLNRFDSNRLVSCAAPAGAWDCFNSPALPDKPATQIRIQDDLNFCVGASCVGGYKQLSGGSEWQSRKRIRFTTTSSLTNDTTTQEAIILVSRKYSPNQGMQARNSAIFGVNVATLFQGNVTVQNGDVGMVFIRAGSEVQGKVTVGPIPGGSPLTSNTWDLCCDTSDSIHVSTVSGSKITKYSSGKLLADNSNLEGNDMAEDIASGDADAPQRDNTLTSARDVAPLELPSGYDCKPGGAQVIPVSTTKTFLPAEGTVDGSDVEYCFDSLEVLGSAKAAFSAVSTLGEVKVIARNKSAASGYPTALPGYAQPNGFAIHIATGAKLYSVAPGASPDPANLRATATPLALYIPQGATGCGGPCGVWLENPATLYGSIAAPQAYVLLGENALVNPVEVVDGARIDAGYVAARDVWYRPAAQALLGHDPSADAPQPNQPGQVKKVKVLGWRKCGNADCTQ